MTAQPDTASAHAQAVRALEAEFGELFTRMRRMYFELAQRVHPDLLPGSYKVLSTIQRRAPLTLSSLAERLMTDKAQVSRAVRELEEFGLVDRAPDPHDGRSSLLSTSADGARLLQAARDAVADPLSGSLRTWPVADIERLTGLLHALTLGETDPRDAGD